MRKILIILFFPLLFLACRSSPKTAADTTTEGTIHISVEKSFKPFFDEQIKVFNSSNPSANIIVSYKSEIDCFKDLALDSTRMIFVTRGLDKTEEAKFKNQLGFTPTFGILAYNAVAILVGKNAKDSTFTIDELRKKLSGLDPQQVIMDGSNLTGIVRFLKDSLVKNGTFGKNVLSAKGSAEVIAYVTEHPNVIGFVGMNWIGDTYDAKQIGYRKNIKTALLECTLCKEKGYYAQPSPSTISKGQYSFTLPIYYILKENAPGLGSGLLNFMSLERGQLIFRRSFLVPAKMGFQKRKGLI